MLGGSALHATPDLEHGLAVEGRAPETCTFVVPGTPPTF